MITREMLPKEFQYLDISNPLFNEALDLCLNSEKNLFIQAKAGCGKSKIIEVISNVLPNCAVTATTANAGANLTTSKVAAKTVHSLVGIPPVPIFLKGDYKCYPAQKKVMQGIETLIIDEVGMLASNVLDYIVDKFEHCVGFIPRIILFGDIFQLPPVVQMSDPVIKQYFDTVYNGNIMFFNAKCFEELEIETHFLQHSYRQNDPEFVRILDDISRGRATQEDLDIINSRKMPVVSFEKTHNNYVYLATTNKVVDKMNKDYFDMFDSNEMREYKPRFSGQTDSLQKIATPVTLKKGMQVMLTANLEKDIFNGLSGKVKELHSDSVIVEFDSKLFKGEYCVSYTEWNEYKYEVIDNKLVRKIVGTVSTLPLKVNKAITVHKSQGKTLEEAYIALNGWTPEGIIYVALSRLTSLDGLGLSRNLTLNDIKVSQEAVNFIDRYYAAEIQKQAAGE